MIKRYFILIAVVLLAGMAVGQDPGDPQPSQGDSNPPCNCDIMVNSMSPDNGDMTIGTAWMNANGMTWDAAVNDAVGISSDGTGGDSSGFGGGEAGMSNWAGGNIPISVLTSGPLRGARAAVNGMGNVAAIGGATVIGGPIGGAIMLMNLFPSLRPGANCPECMIGMVDPVQIDYGGQMIGNANAIAIRKYGFSFDDINKIPEEERIMFLKDKYEAIEGLVRYNQFVDAGRRLDDFGPFDKINETAQQARALRALVEYEGTYIKLRNWNLTMQAPMIDSNLPDAILH
jgi:hypothetical protein